MAGMQRGLSISAQPPSPVQHQHDHVRRRYRTFSRHYDRSFGRYTAWSREIILGAISDRPAPSRVLDVCCGTGVVTAALADRFPAAEVVGLDLSTDMLGRARERLAGIAATGSGGTNTASGATPTAPEAPAGRAAPRVRLVEAPAERLPIEPASVDLLICANAFHLIDRQHAAMEEFARVLVPGGRVVILDWTRESRSMRLLVGWLHLTQKARRRMHSRESLGRLMRSVGLEPEFARRDRIPPIWGLMTLRARKLGGAANGRSK